MEGFVELINIVVGKLGIAHHGLDALANGMGDAVDHVIVAKEACHRGPVVWRVHFEL